MEVVVSLGADKLMFATLRQCQSSFTISGWKFKSAEDILGFTRLNQTEKNGRCYNKISHNINKQSFEIKGNNSVRMFFFSNWIYYDEP